MNTELSPKVSPSLMCLSPFELKGAVEEFECAGIEYLHIDVMDGVFVPNFTLGVGFVADLRKHTNIPMDLHLMINSPENKLAWFEPQPGDYVSVHYESTPHILRALQMIRNYGAKPMLALNPSTPLSVLEYTAAELDGVLVMTVNPGFAGQSLIPQTIDKLRNLRNWLDQHGFSHVEIEVDGNVSLKNAERMRAAGANIFVAGTSGLFLKGAPLDEQIRTFRQAIGGGRQRSHDGALTAAGV